MSKVKLYIARYASKQLMDQKWGVFCSLIIRVQTFPFIVQMKCRNCLVKFTFENDTEVDLMVDESTIISKKATLVICM